MNELPQYRLRRKRRALVTSILGRLIIVLLWIIGLPAVVVGAFLVAFILFPPFGQQSTARVLLVGLDQEERGVSRSDTIIMAAVRLDGSGATLLSVPRDAYVTIPGHRGHRKINAAYAMGQVTLLRRTLAQADVMNVDLPHYIVFDSDTVAAVVDALGGIDVVVPHDMDYDDNWGNLHIHLKAGNRHLDGKKTVGFLRWRKNNHGRQASDDFKRTERQRKVLIAIKDKLRSWEGVRRAPQVYRAFRKHGQTDLTFLQSGQLGLNLKQITSETVPGETSMRRGVSYVFCDWETGRRIWQRALRNNE